MLDPWLVNTLEPSLGRLLVALRLAQSDIALETRPEALQELGAR